VDVSVQVVERWILVRLRNRRFFSLAELNQPIHELLEDLNRRVTTPGRIAPPIARGARLSHLQAATHRDLPIR